MVYSPVEIYFRLSRRSMSRLAAGRDTLTLDGGGLYMVLSAYQDRGDLDPVSCSRSDETIEPTFLIKCRSILNRLPMTPEEMLNVMELILNKAIRLLRSRDCCIRGSCGCDRSHFHTAAWVLFVYSQILYAKTFPTGRAQTSTGC